MLRAALTAFIVTLAFCSAPALADAPWSPPVTLAGTSGYNAAVVTTGAGHSVVASSAATRPLPAPNTLLGMLELRTLRSPAARPGRSRS
jgi:hypothetical protein